MYLQDREGHCYMIWKKTKTEKGKEKEKDQRGGINVNNQN